MDKQDFKSHDGIDLFGDIAWAIASLIYPELIRQNHVELTQADISAFRSLIYSAYDDLSKPDLRKKLNPADAAASYANIKRVVNTDDQKALLSGAIRLDEPVQQLNTVNPFKKFIYPRYAYVGWISGYIIDKISKQYSELAVK